MYAGLNYKRMENRSRRLLQDLCIRNNDFINVRVSGPHLEASCIPKEFRNNGWLLFQVKQVLRKQGDAGEDTVVASVMCTSYLDLNLNGQVHLKLGEAWELDGADRSRGLEDDHGHNANHPHNLLSLPRFFQHEQFTEDPLPEVTSIESRMRIKSGLSKSISSLSEISESDPCDPVGSVRGVGIRRLSLDLVGVPDERRPTCLQIYTKKEENILYRICSFRAWLGDISNKAYRRLLLRSFKEIDTDLMILARCWQGLASTEMDEDIRKILDAKVNPVLQLASSFQDLVEEHNNSISNMNQGEMLPENLSVFIYCEDTNDLEYDEERTTTELVGSNNWDLEEHGETGSSLTGGIIIEDLESMNIDNGGILFHQGQLVQIIEETPTNLRVVSLDILREEALVPRNLVNTNQEDFKEAINRSRLAHGANPEYQSILRAQQGNPDHDDDMASTAGGYSPQREHPEVMGKVRPFQGYHIYEDVSEVTKPKSRTGGATIRGKENERPPLREIDKNQQTVSTEEKIEKLQNMAEVLESIVKQQAKETSELREALMRSEEKNTSKHGEAQAQEGQRYEEEVRKRETIEMELARLKEQMRAESEERERERNRREHLEKEMRRMLNIVDEANAEVKKSREHQARNLKVMGERREEVKEINGQIQRLYKERERSSEREKGFLRELLEKERKIEELTKIAAVKTGNNRTSDPEESDMDRRERMRMEDEEIELRCYIQDIRGRISKFKGEVNAQYNIAIRDDVQPSTEASKMTEKMSRKGEELHKEYIGLRARVDKISHRSMGRIGKQDDEACRDVKENLDEVESIIESLKVRTVKSVSNTAGDIQAFKLASIHNLILDRLVPGSTFHEWLRMAKNLQKKHNIEDSIMLLKVYSSMEANCQSLMISLKSKNPKSIAAIEEILYPTYGLPITLLEMGMKYHTKWGQVPYPLDGDNVSDVKAVAEAHIMAINAAICQLDYHKEKYGIEEGLRKMEQGYLSSKSLYDLAKNLPQDRLGDAITEMISLNPLDHLDYLKKSFQRCLTVAQNYISVYGVQDFGEKATEKKPTQERDKSWKAPTAGHARSRRHRILFNQTRTKNQSGAAQPHRNQSPFPTEIGNIDLFNSCLATQFNRASTGNFTPMVIQTSPGHLSFSNDLQQQVLACTNQDKGRAAALMNLMGTRNGCGICLTILKEQKNQVNKVLLPHFRMSKSTKLHDKSLITSCPMLLRLTGNNAHDLILKQNDNCMKCGNNLTSNICNNKNCHKYGCNSCRRSVAACTCNHLMKDLKQKFIENYEEMLGKHKANITSISPGSSPSVFIAAFIHETIWESDEESNHGHDREYSLATDVDRGGIGTPGIFETREQMIQRFKNVRKRAKGKQLFTIIRVLGPGGRLETFIHDSGCSECCLHASLVGNFLPAGGKSSKSVETAGGNIASQDSFTALLPLSQEQAEDYIEVEGVAMQKILSPLPVVDLTKKMDRLYENYRRHCGSTSTRPTFEPTQLPKLVGGKIGGLIGNRVFIPKEIFSCPETGLTIYRTPLRGQDGRDALAVSGLLCEEEDGMTGLATVSEERLLVLASKTEEDEEFDDGMAEIDESQNAVPDQVFIRENDIDKKRPLEEVVDKRNNVADEELMAPREAIRDSDEAWKKGRLELKRKQRSERINKMIREQERRVWDRFMNVNKVEGEPYLKETEGHTDLNSVLANLSQEEIQLNYSETYTPEHHQLSHLEFPVLEEPSRRFLTKERREIKEDTWMKDNGKEDLAQKLRESGLSVTVGKRKKRLKCKRRKATTLTNFLRDQTEEGEYPDRIVCICGETHRFVAQEDGSYKVIEKPKTPLCTISLPQGFETDNDFIGAVDTIRELFRPENKAITPRKLTSVQPSNKDLLDMESMDTQEQDVENIRIIKVEHASLCTNWTEEELGKLSEIEKSFVEDTYDAVTKLEVAAQNGDCVDMDVLHTTKHHCATADSLHSTVQDRITDEELDDGEMQAPAMPEDASILEEYDKQVLQWFESRTSEGEPIIKIIHKETSFLPDHDVTIHPIQVLFYHQGKRDWRLAGVLESLCDSKMFRNSDKQGTDSLPFNGSFKEFLMYNSGLKQQVNYHYNEATLRSTQLGFNNPGIYRVNLDIILMFREEDANVNLALRRMCNDNIQGNSTVLDDVKQINYRMSVVNNSCEVLHHYYPKLLHGCNKFTGYCLCHKREQGKTNHLGRPNYVITANLSGALLGEIARLRLEVVKRNPNLASLLKPTAHVTLGVFRHTGECQHSLEEVVQSFAKKIRSLKFEQILVSSTLQLVHWEPNVLALRLHSPRLVKLNKMFQESMMYYDLIYESVYNAHTTIISDPAGEALDKDVLLRIECKPSAETISQFYLFRMKDFASGDFLKTLNLTEVPCVWRDAGQEGPGNSLQSLHDMVSNNGCQPLHYPTQHNDLRSLTDRATEAITKLLDKETVNFSSGRTENSDMNYDDYQSLATRISKARSLHMDQGSSNNTPADPLQHLYESVSDDEYLPEGDYDRAGLTDSPPEEGPEMPMLELSAPAPRDICCSICGNIAINAVRTDCCDILACRRCAVRSLLPDHCTQCGELSSDIRFTPQGPTRIKVQEYQSSRATLMDETQETRQVSHRNETRKKTILLRQDFGSSHEPGNKGREAILYSLAGDEEFIFTEDKNDETYVVTRGKETRQPTLMKRYMAPGGPDLRAMLNIELDDSRFVEILKGILAPEFCPYQRCNACLACPDCAPSTLFRVAELKKAQKIKQNSDIFKAVAPIQTSDGSFKIIARYPLQEDLVQRYLLGSNIKTITKEFDMKIGKLSREQRDMAQEEFSKLVKLGIIVPFTSLPEEVQKTINDNKVQFYLSAAPSYKLSSLSTVCRISVNGSKKNKLGYSINDLMSTGHFEMDLHSSFRSFRLGNYGVITDLTKFFNSIFLSVNSLHISQMVWRDNCDPSGNLARYIITRLTYGLRASTSICQAALIYICEYVEKICNGECKQGEQDCKAINHLFVKMIYKIYVDDLCFSCSSLKDIMRLVEFGEDILKKFGFRTKGWIHKAMISSPQTLNMLDEQGRAAVLGYYWNIITDKIRTKTPLIHNGSKFRNYLVKYRMRNFVDESCVQRRFEPPELMILDTDNKQALNYEDTYKIYADIPHTIRFLSSKTSAIYDPTGILGPLTGQLRFILSKIIAKHGLIYDKEISKDEYQLWFKAYYEILRGTKMEFNRQLQNGDQIPGTRVYGVILTDYSDVANITFYIVYQTPRGKESVFILSRSLLLKVSVPRGELSAISMAAAARRTVMEELKGMVSFIYIFSDSKVALFWSNKRPDQLDNFNGNRVRGIQSCLDSRDDLWYVASASNAADIGSKFVSTENNHRNFLTTSDVGPDSFFHRPRWILDIEKSVEEGKVKPMSRILSDTNCNLLGDQEQNSYITGLRGQSQSYLQKGLQDKLVLPDSTTQDGKILGSCDATLLVNAQTNTMTCKDGSMEYCMFNNSAQLFKECLMLEEEESFCPSARETVLMSINHNEGIPDGDEDIEWATAYELSEEQQREHEDCPAEDPILALGTTIMLEDQQEKKATQIKTDLGQQMYQKFHLRYKTEISNTHYNIRNIRHNIPYERFMTKDFTKIVNEHRMLHLAIIKFLGFIRRPFLLERSYTPLIDSSTSEVQSLIKYSRNLPEPQESRERHRREVKATPFLNGNPRLCDIAALPDYVSNVKNQHLNTLARRVDDDNLTMIYSFKQKYWLHACTGRVVRDISEIKNLLHRASNANQGADRRVAILKAWPTIVNLVNLVSYRYQTTSILSNIVLNDVTYLIYQSILGGCKEDLELAANKYQVKLGSLLKKLRTIYEKEKPEAEYREALEKAYEERWDYNPEDRDLTEQGYAKLKRDLSTAHYRTQEIMRIENLLAHPINLATLSCAKLPTSSCYWSPSFLPRTIDCIDGPNYSRCERITAAYMAMASTSEVLAHTSDTRIKNHVVMVQGYALSKSRFSDYHLLGEKNLTQELLTKAGYTQTSLVIDTFSTLSLPLFYEHHLKGRFGLDRREIDKVHSGRYKTLMGITRTKHLLGAQALIAALIKGCHSCCRRLKKFEAVPEGRIHSQGLLTSAINLVLYIDLAGPVMIRTRAGSLETRSHTKQLQKLYIIVAVCSTSRLVTLAMVGSRKTSDIALGLRAIVSRTNLPYLLIADNEGAFHAIAKEGQIGMADGDYITEFGLPIHFVPPTERGHISNATCERRIRTLKELIGALDFSKTGLDVAGAVNVLAIVEEMINSTPVGTRSMGKRFDILSSSPNAMFISPNSFLGRLNTRRPIGLIRLDRSAENTMAQSIEISKTVTRMMENYLVSLQREAIRGFDLKPGNVQVGDICAFKIKESQFHQALTPWRYGLITKLHISELDGRARIVTLRYTTMPGDVINKVLDSKPRHVTTRRRLDQIIKLSSSSHNHQAFQFYFDAEFTERLINRQFGGDLQLDDGEACGGAEATEQDPNTNNKDPSLGAQNRQGVRKRLRERWITRKSGGAVATICNCCSYANMECILASVILSSVANCTRNLPLAFVKIIYLLMTASFLICDDTRWGCDQFLLASQNIDMGGVYERELPRVLIKSNGTLLDWDLEEDYYSGTRFALPESLGKMGSIYSSVVRDARNKTRDSRYIFVPRERVDGILFFSTLAPEGSTPLDIPFRRWGESNDTDKIFCTDASQNLFLNEEPGAYSSAQGPGNETSGGDFGADYQEYHTNPNGTPVDPLDYQIDYHDTDDDLENPQADEAEASDLGAGRKHTGTRKQMVNEGEFVSLRCLEDTSNIAKFVWKRHFKENTWTALAADNNVLTIGSVSPEDEALYKCLAKTNLGELITVNTYLYVRRTSVYPREDFQSETDEDLELLFEAYSCDTAKQSNLVSLDLRSGIGCNKADYQNYHGPKPARMMILQEKSSHSFQALHCSLRIKTRHAYCGQGLFSMKKYTHSNGFRVSHEEMIDLNTKQCMDAYKFGTMSIRIGEQTVHIPTRVKETGTYNINTYLSGSFLYKNDTCKGANAIRAYWSKNTPLEDPRGQIVNLMGTLRVQLVTALTDIDAGEVLIPQYGLRFNSTNGRNPIYNSENGIYLAVEQEKFQRFVWVYKGLAKLLQPTRGDLPELAIFDMATPTVENIQRLAFSLGRERVIKETICYETQYKSYFVCKNGSFWQSFEKAGTESLQDLSTGSLILMGAKIDDTIAGIIEQVCVIQELLISRAARDFERFGADLIYPERRGRGTTSSPLGEVGVIQTCDRKLVRAASRDGKCCRNLKVHMVGPNEDKEKVHYLQPLDRILSSTCDEVPCSEKLSIVHFNTRNIAMCQTRGSLKPCKWTMHKQNYSFAHLMFRPLQVLDYGTRHISKQEIELIAGRVATEANKGLDFLGKVVSNAEQCQGTVECHARQLVDDHISLEFERISGTQNKCWEIQTWHVILMSIVVSWACLCIFIGLLRCIFDFGSRIKTMTDDQKSTGLCDLLLGMLVDLYLNLSPIEKKTNQFSIKSIETQVSELSTSLSEVQEILTVLRRSGQINLTRIRLLESAARPTTNNPLVSKELNKTFIAGQPSLSSHQPGVKLANQTINVSGTAGQPSLSSHQPGVKLANQTISVSAIYDRPREIQLIARKEGDVSSDSEEMISLIPGLPSTEDKPEEGIYVSMN